MTNIHSRTTGRPSVDRFVLVALTFLLLHNGSQGRAAESIDFATQIAPIFEQRCVKCHAPGNEKGDISLATIADVQEQEYVVAGDPEASGLFDLITADDGDSPAMPREGEPLSAEQVALIRQWIEEGADWPEDVVVRVKSRADTSWWSLRQLANDPPPPSPSEIPPEWQSNPIDRFIFARMAQDDLSPNPPADRRTLIRRATYDLIGLPPTPEEVVDFVADPDPQAYERLIDRLLASPHYGERWGRHWLDVVRFGESNGYERNVIINDLWPFRDYVIASLNRDKPFDQFLREHLSGDVFGAGEPEHEVGTAFLVAGPYDDVGNQDAAQAAQIRANTIDEMIRATSEAFLGLTIGCARCHDHKFDPILQRDYYAWYATFSGVRHGSRVVATAQQQAEHDAKVTPLAQRRDDLTRQRDELRAAILQRGLDRLTEYEATWPREPADRQGTEETFDPVEKRFVRLVSEGQDGNPADRNHFRIDEFEVWSAGAESRNVALASAGAKASGPSRQIEDFPHAYGPHLAIDGKTGARFLATGGQLTIELAEPTTIDRVRFSSARGAQEPSQPKFTFVAEYRIETSPDGEHWTTLADSHDRQPVSEAHRNHRLNQLETTDADRRQLEEWDRELAQVQQELAAIPPLPTVWVGQRVEADATGPHHVFIGGSPQRPGDEVVPASLSALADVTETYTLPADAPESERRQQLADWMVGPDNPLTPRVLANRLWHYHFGTGIVDTPSDFGYMGGRPTHPLLLDWLAGQLRENGWRLKPMHKLIMLSQTYQQSSEHRDEAARSDGDARLMWRFPPRRLSAEEIRDTMLMLADRLDPTMGGPGFRLYHFMQDNVCTYTPLDEHGPETFRRAVYHQNARAAIVDLMSDFDLPDCAFSTPRRSETTTPLQALTMLNHSFTLDMADAMSQRLARDAGPDPHMQIRRAFELCYGQSATAEEVAACDDLVRNHDLAALCRVLLNSSRLIVVE